MWHLQSRPLALLDLERALCLLYPMSQGHGQASARAERTSRDASPRAASACAPNRSIPCPAPPPPLSPPPQRSRPCRHHCHPNQMGRRWAGVLTVASSLASFSAKPHSRAPPECQAQRSQPRDPSSGPHSKYHTTPRRPPAAVHAMRHRLPTHATTARLIRRASPRHDPP